MIVMVLISAVSSFMGKGNKKGELPPEETGRADMPPPRESNDPLDDFRRMIAEAREEAEKAANPQPPIPAPVPTPLARQVSSPPPPPVGFIPQVPKAPPLKPSSFPSNADLKKKKARTRGDLSLNTLLRSPESARKAIILTEVLGKPKGV